MTAKVTICGLGPGDPGHLTAATRAAIDSVAPEARFVRTRRHPTASVVDGAASFDDLYEQSDTFDEVYHRIADALVAAAGSGHVLYAVPGSPLVLEESVRRLRSDDRVEIELLPAVSFLDEVWARLGVDPVDDGVRLIDGHRFAVQAAGERGPLLVAHAHAPWVLSDIKLAVDAGPEQRAVVLQGLGTPGERVFEVAWPDLDRDVEPDHLTSLYLPSVAAPVGQELVRSAELMHRLRQECPWDAEQDHWTLRRYLLEETCEVLEVLDAGAASAAAGGIPDGSFYEDLEEELGDLWFQVLFHAELASEAGQFTIADVAQTMHDKLVYRHPHVFGDVEVDSGAELIANWEQLKQATKERQSAIDGIPPDLPALAKADKLLQRAERAGWPTGTGDLGHRIDGVLSTTLGTDTGPNAEAELGRWLLAMVAFARRRSVDPESALRTAIAAAQARFHQAEQAAATAGLGSPRDDWLLG